MIGTPAARAAAIARFSGSTVAAEHSGRTPPERRAAIPEGSRKPFCTSINSSATSVVGIARLTFIGSLRIARSAGLRDAS